MASIVLSHYHIIISNPVLSQSLPVIDSIDFTSKSHILHLVAEHGDTSLTLDSDWIAMLTGVLKLYDSSTLASFWATRCMDPIPDDRGDVVHELVLSLNNERLAFEKPVLARASPTDR